MQKQKQLKFMFLALAMLLAANNVSYAQCTISGLGGGTGDQADPYIISSIGHLVALSDYFSHYGNACYASYFKITADIDAAGSAFVPLSYFGGNIDGQHHTISNITTTGRAGFIEYGDGCHISNLGLVNVNVLNNTNTGVGGFVGSVYGGVFVRCYVSGGHIEGTEDVGGFVGYDDPYSNYNQCYSTANVIAAGRDDGFTAAGGFGGYCYGVFYNCYAKGNVTGTSLANYAPGAYIGGFIGVSERNNGDGTQFFNCYARGNVSGRGVVGGFAGGPNYTNDAAHNCYSTGQVSRIADTLFGGFYGWVGGVSDCYYVSTWQGTDATGDNWSSITNTNVGTGYTSAYMQTTSFLAEINANATNPINPYIADVSGVNGGYPILSWMEYGSEANPYLIYTIEDLRGLSDSVQNNHLQAGKYWYLMNDLTFTDADLIYDLDADGTAESNFIPIGGRTAAMVRNDNYTFKGNFNGGNHVISNLTIHASTNILHCRGHIALFGKIDGNVTIKNLGLKNIDLLADYNSGGLVGIAGYSGDNNMNISNCYVVGGTIRQMTGSTSNNFGGLIGYFNSSATDNSRIISKCFVRDVNIIAVGTEIGGLVGDIWDGRGVTISNCYTSNCTISGMENVGGLIGKSAGNSSGGNATIYHCYAASTVTRTSGDAATFGGLTGYSATVPVITDCYYLSTWSPQGLANNSYGSPMTEPTMRNGGTLRGTLDASQIGTWFDDNSSTWTNDWLHNYGYPVLGFEPIADPYIIRNGETVTIANAADYAARPTNITIQYGGSLINNTTSPFDNVKVERNLLNEQYVFLGSAFGNITAGYYLGEDGSQTYANVAHNIPVAMLRFDTLTNMWANNTDPANPSYNQLGYNSIMERSHGYLAYVLDPGYPTLVRPQGEVIAHSMTGTLFNDANATVTMVNNGPIFTYEADHPGQTNNALWYPLSNPYPASLWANVFIAQNLLQLSTSSVYVLEANQTWSAIDNSAIYIGKAFFVTGRNGVSQRTHTFSFDKSQIQSTAKSSNVRQNNSITITSTANNESKEAYIKINEDASNGFDFYDAYKMLGMNSMICEPYFVVDSSTLAINSISVLPYECPMNISSKATNNVTLSFSNIPEDVEVILIDGEQEIAVSNGDTYETIVSEGQNTERFRVRLNKLSNGLANVTTHDISLWVANDALNINGESLKSVIIYNALGQVVYSQKISGSSFKTLLDLPAGAYTAKASSKTSAKNLKFVINK